MLDVVEEEAAAAAVSEDVAGAEADALLVVEEDDLLVAEAVEVSVVVEEVEVSVAAGEEVEAEDDSKLCTESHNYYILKDLTCGLLVRFGFLASESRRRIQAFKGERTNAADLLLNSLKVNSTVIEGNLSPVTTFEHVVFLENHNLIQRVLWKLEASSKRVKIVNKTRYQR